MGRGRGIEKCESSVGLRKLWLVNAPFVLALVLDLSACTDSPPAIGSHLPGTFAVASDAFDQRVKARFPAGSNEAAFRAELARALCYCSGPRLGVDFLGAVSRQRISVRGRLGNPMEWSRRQDCEYRSQV